MSGVGRDKPNMIFRLSPVRSYHDDQTERYVKAKLDVTGALLSHGGETSMQTYFEYDRIALGGRPVRKRKRRLKENKNRKKCTVSVQITNYEMEKNKEWELIFTVSSRQGERKWNSKMKYPYVQLFRTHEPIVSYKKIKRKNKEDKLKRKVSKKKTYRITKRTNNDNYIMKETTKRKKMIKLRRFYTKIHDNPDDPVRIFIPKQYFTVNPVTGDKPDEERETITYTLRMAGKRRHHDQMLFFHQANMFIINEDIRSRLEQREVDPIAQRQAELERELQRREEEERLRDLELERRRGLEQERAMKDRLDQLERIYELRIEEHRLREDAEQSLLVDEERRIVRENEIRDRDRRRRDRED